VSPTAIVAFGFEGSITDWPITRHVIIASSLRVTVRMTHSAPDAAHTGHEKENCDTDCDPNPALSEPCHFCPLSFGNTTIAGIVVFNIEPNQQLGSKSRKSLEC
jgi:hypothetical protein